MWLLPTGSLARCQRKHFMRLVWMKAQDEGRERDEKDMGEMLHQLQVGDEAGDADFVFTCGLTMEPFRDPVISPDGNSYERSALIEHLHKVLFSLSLCSGCLSICLFGSRRSSPSPSSGKHMHVLDQLVARTWYQVCAAGFPLNSACGFVQVGKFEPVTRNPLQANQLISNTRLRQATQQYLDDHPWAWKECIS